MILLVAAVFLALLHSSSLLASERTVEEVDSWDWGIRIDINSLSRGVWLASLRFAARSSLLKMKEEGTVEVCALLSRVLEGLE